MLEQRCRGPTAMGPAQPWLFSGPSQESSQPDRGLRYQGKSAQPRGQTPGKVHRCAHCRKRFPGWVALWLHARRCQARLPLPCHECNQRFRHAPFLALHLQVHASAVPDLGFICHLCGHSFRGWVALVLHLRAHSASKRPITCPECDRRFWRQKQLRAHLRRCQPPVPEARPFICGNCGRSFAQWDQLVVHKRVHVAEALEEAAAKALGPRPRGRPAAPRPGGDAVDRPFQCACCGKRFRHKPNLIAHRRVHTGERPHQCPECGKRFTNKPYLTSHRRIHTGEKPYPCTECGRRFRHKPNLLSHSKIHKRLEVSAQAAPHPESHQIAAEPMAQPALGVPLGSPRTPAEAPALLHSCSDCGRSFRLERFLRLHQRQHTGERPFACTECGKNFGKKTHLVAHSRVHSGERPFACEECGRRFSRAATWQPTGETMHQRGPSCARTAARLSATSPTWLRTDASTQARNPMCVPTVAKLSVRSPTWCPTGASTQASGPTPAPTVIVASVRSPILSHTGRATSGMAPSVVPSVARPLMTRTDS